MFSRSVIGLVVCQITVMGVLGLKKAALPSLFLLPLPFITAAFFQRCQDRFGLLSDVLPIEVRMWNLQYLSIVVL